MTTNTRAGAAGVLAIALTAAAPVSGAPVAAAQDTHIEVRVADRSLVVGQPARVSGRAARRTEGRTVALEHRTRDGEWVTLATARVSERGRFRLRRAVPRPGALRVVLRPAPGAAVASAPVASAAEPVTVAPRVGIASRRLHVRAGRRTAVRGRVGTRRAGVPVALELRGRRGWRRVDAARTSPRGHFLLRDRRRAPMSAPARVVVRPHDGLSRARRKVGRLNVYRYANASWYGPGLYGNRLGCGGRLAQGTIGVAHKTLRRRGRTVRVRVIDRGPYVAGREYDLTAATARRIGFSGHGPVLATR